MLTGSDDYRKTGTVTVKAYRDTDLELSSVKLGSYRLTLARHGSTTLVADETFALEAPARRQAEPVGAR